jgi:hypothetical protein
MNDLHRAEMADQEMADAMDKLVVVKSAIYTSGERDPRAAPPRQDTTGRLHLMGPDPRLPKMPKAPTLFDFFKLRFGPAIHMLQSARLAQKNGCDEKVVLACLLHDCSAAGFIRADHGYWAAQLIAPYVDEEVTFAVRYHQVLRFYPDESFGYKYPDSYIRLFGPNYKPEPYLDRAYEYCRNHKWYSTARLLTVNDLYSFDPNIHIELEEFTDVIDRNFRQPAEGLGFDDSPSAHMWRTINWPTRYL